MSEKRRGLGRGLGALIPTGPQAYAERPSDVFFRDRSAEAPRDASAMRGPRWSDSPSWDSFRPAAGQVHGPEDGFEAADVRRDAAERPVIAPREAAPPEGGTAGRPGDPAVDEEASARPGEVTMDGRSEAGDGAPNAEDLRPVPGARYVEVPIDAIRANPRQPRSAFDEDELAELADSIRGVGLLQPVVVRPLVGEELRQADDAGAFASDGDPERRSDVATSNDHAFELVMGERRWRAARLAGLVTLPAIVKETPDDAMLRDALLENLHRSQLNPLDEAAAYQQLLEDFGCTQEELATRIGRSRSQISNTVRLLRLPPGVALRVAAGVLSAGHARALLSLDDPAAMERLAQRIVAEGLSVRSVEEIVALGDTGSAPARRTREPAPPNERLEHIAARLADRLDTRVLVAMGRRRGKLTVEFADPDDLERILTLLEAGAEADSTAGL